MSRPIGAQWTNPSVLAFAGDGDPVEAIRNHARRVVLDALDRGWRGPPFDPVALAELLKLNVDARQDVVDARTVATPGGRLRIEFNPTRARARVRYSLAHEIAHTFFDDCAARVRHRGPHGESEADGWQLEALCNIAAAELLMPLGSLRRLSEFDLDTLLKIRTDFDVSTEAAFIRVVELTDAPCAMICASAPDGGAYRVDYFIASNTWEGSLTRARAVGAAAVVDDLLVKLGAPAGDYLWPTRRSPAERPEYPIARGILNRRTGQRLVFPTIENRFKSHLAIFGLREALGFIPAFPDIQRLPKHVVLGLVHGYQPLATSFLRYEKLVRANCFAASRVLLEGGSLDLGRFGGILTLPLAVRELDLLSDGPPQGRSGRRGEWRAAQRRHGNSAPPRTLRARTGLAGLSRVKPAESQSARRSSSGMRVADSATPLSRLRRNKEN